MHCYACEKEAEQQCRRCGRLYCEDHGDNLCGECLNPASAVPSPTIFRGSLLALIAGTAIVIWLLVAPPALPGDAVAVGEQVSSQEQEPVEALPTVDPTVQPAPADSTASPTADLTASPTAEPTEGAATSCPEGTQAEGEQCVYTVVAGDTLSTIAVRFGVTETAISEANALTSETLQIGQTLIIPSP